MDVCVEEKKMQPGFQFKNSAPNFSHEGPTRSRSSWEAAGTKIQFIVVSHPNPLQSESVFKQEILILKSFLKTNKNLGVLWDDDYYTCREQKKQRPFSVLKKINLYRSKSHSKNKAASQEHEREH